MGQSQLLIITVSVLIIGLALLAAVFFFRSGDIESNEKAMINDINQIAHVSVRYFSRPKSLQGGGGSFVGFELPTKLRTSLNGRYSILVVSAGLLQIQGTSARDSNNTLSAQIGTDGKASSWTFTGDFR